MTDFRLEEFSIPDLAPEDIHSAQVTLAEMALKRDHPAAYLRDALQALGIEDNQLHACYRCDALRREAAEIKRQLRKMAVRANSSKPEIAARGRRGIVREKEKLAKSEAFLEQHYAEVARARA